MTDDTKHTPGPWKFGHVGTEAFWIGPDYNQTPVAHVDHDMEYARDNSRANAEFIVRACNGHADLLAACQGLVSEYDADEVCWTEGQMRLMSTARAAIAKATGQKEQP